MQEGRGGCGCVGVCVGGWGVDCADRKESTESTTQEGVDGEEAERHSMGNRNKGKQHGMKGRRLNRIEKGPR